MSLTLSIVHVYHTLEIDTLWLLGVNRYLVVNSKLSITFFSTCIHSDTCTEKRWLDKYVYMDTLERLGWVTLQDSLLFL